MNLLAKLALTVVMLAIGAAPALALHADTFLPGRGDASTREAAAPPPTAPAPPAAESPQKDEALPDEGLAPAIGIPQTDADWNAWIADRTAQDEPAVDPVDAVEPPVDESDVDPYGGFEDEPGSDDVEPEIAPEDEAEDEGGLLGRLLG